MASYTVIFRDSRVPPNKNRDDGMYVFTSKKRADDFVEDARAILREQSQRSTLNLPQTDWRL